MLVVHLNREEKIACILAAFCVRLESYLELSELDKIKAMQVVISSDEDTLADSLLFFAEKVLCSGPEILLASKPYFEHQAHLLETQLHENTNPFFKMLFGFTRACFEDTLSFLEDEASISFRP